MNTVLLLLKVTDLALQVAESVPVLKARYEAQRKELEAMQPLGRDPTPEEWAAMDQRIEGRIANLTARAEQS